MTVWVELFCEDFLEDVWLEEAVQGGAEKHEGGLSVILWEGKTRLLFLLTHLFSPSQSSIAAV